MNKIQATAEVVKKIVSKRKRRFKVYAFVLLGVMVIVLGWSAVSLYSFFKAKKYKCRDIDVVLYKDKVILSGRLFPCEKKGNIYICPVLDVIKENNFLQPYVMLDENEKKLYFSAKVDMEALKQEYSLKEDMTTKDICFVSGLGYSKDFDLCVDMGSVLSCEAR